MLWWESPLPNRDFPAAEGPFLHLTGTPGCLCCPGRRNLNVAVGRYWERVRDLCARRGRMNCVEVFRWDDPSVRAACTGGVGAEAKVCEGDPPASISLCFSAPPQDMAAVGLLPVEEGGCSGCRPAELPSAAFFHIQLGSGCLPRRGRTSQREAGVKTAHTVGLSSWERMACPLRLGALRHPLFCPHRIIEW